MAPCRIVRRLSSSRKPLTVALLLAAALFAATRASALTDITSEALPHSADSYYDGWFLPNNVSDNLPGLYDNAWHSADSRAGRTFPHWIQIDLGAPYVVQQLNLLVFSEYSSGNHRLKEFWFEGSNDGITYVPLHATVNVYNDVHTWQGFTFTHATGYRYFRLRGLNNWCAPGAEPEASQMIVEEWEMFGEPAIAVVGATWGGIKGLYR